MKQLKILPLITGLLLVAAPALADKPRLIDCDAEKAARNAAMEAVVGVHGPCDPEKLAEQKKEDAMDKVDGAKDKAADHKEDVHDKLGEHKKKDD